MTGSYCKLFVNLLVLLVIFVRKTSLQELEPASKINISAIVTNADNDYTDIYVETNNKSDLFHRTVHLNKSALPFFKNLIQPTLLQPAQKETNIPESSSKSINKTQINVTTEVEDQTIFGDTEKNVGSQIPQEVKGNQSTTGLTKNNTDNLPDNTTDTLKDSDKHLEEEDNGFDADNYVDEDDISEGLYGEESDSAEFLRAVEKNPEKFITFNYIAKILVTDQGSKNKYTISEIHSMEEETIQLSLIDPRRNATSTCSLYTGGFGHATTGVRCRLSRNLPQECFCWDGLCLYPFLTLSSALRILISQKKTTSDLIQSWGENTAKTGGDVRLFSWTAEGNNLKIKATFRLVDRILSPTQMQISGFGYSLGSQEDKASIHYSVLQFEPVGSSRLRILLDPNETAMTVLQQGPGIFCPRSNLHPPRSLPELPNQFSVKIETAMEGSNEVSYSHHDYDLNHKLVSMKLRPRIHTAPSVFLTTLALAPHLLPQTYNIIHDFNTGLQYTISERTGNCTVEGIPDWMGDAAKMQGRPLRLKLASELLQVDPADFVYSGRRLLRGITADVWTAERIGETEADEYSTIELYFSTPEWKVQMDSMNELKNIPLGMTTYYADSRTAPFFHTKVESQYFEFSGSQPSWKQFDISHCLPSSQRLYLRLSLHVSYGQLVQFSLAVAQDSIRAALAKAGKVSPLRLLDLFLSSSRSKNGVDVWFVLLDKPVIHDKVEAAHKDSTTLTQAFKNMEKFFRKEGKLKLQLDRERNMVVGIIHDSFQVVGETSHPSFRNKSYHFLRTQYTAGSMAGLGFSMAVLGLSIGILVGFLLWKRRLGLPHFPHMHFPNSQTTPILSSPTTDLAQLTPAYPGPPLHEPRY